MYIYPSLPYTHVAVFAELTRNTLWPPGRELCRSVKFIFDWACGSDVQSLHKNMAASILLHSCFIWILSGRNRYNTTSCSRQHQRVGMAPCHSIKPMDMSPSLICLSLSSAWEAEAEAEAEARHASASASSHSRQQPRSWLLSTAMIGHTRGTAVKDQHLPVMGGVP